MRSLTLSISMLAIISSCQSASEPIAPQCESAEKCNQNLPPENAAKTGTGYCGNLPPRPEGVMLTVPMIYQNCPTWCWAAAATMVSNYYSKPYQQCYLASLAMYSSDLTPNSLCCGNYNCAYCGRGISMAELESLLYRIQLYSQVGGILSERQLQTELSNGRPVILLIHNLPVGHAVVVSGYEFDRNSEDYIYKVQDPTLGENIIYYPQLVGGYPSGIASWAQTLYRISPREDGCNEKFDPLCGCR